MIFSRKKEIKELREELRNLKKQFDDMALYTSDMLAAKHKKLEDWCLDTDKKQEEYYEKIKIRDLERKVEHDKHIDNMEHHAVQVERYLDNQTKLLSIMVDKLK